MDDKQIAEALRVAESTEAVIKEGHSYILHGNYDELVVLAQAYRAQQARIAALEAVVDIAKKAFPLEAIPGRWPPFFTEAALKKLEDLINALAALEAKP